MPEITEETPLMHTSHRQAARKRTAKTYGGVLGYLLAITIFVYCIRDTLPKALSDSEAMASDSFAGLHAYENYMARMTEPRPVNSRALAEMNAWLASTALAFQAEAAQNGVQVDVSLNDSMAEPIQSYFQSGKEYLFVQQRNVVVRIHGTENVEDAILVNAHYDSVPTSFGVTDDGIGVTVTMELLRYFVHHPPRNTMIFLFNNFEEGGLVGAFHFAKHPWFPSVRFFINLEGAGAGGRSILFRCSSMGAAKIMASHSSVTHASLLGNDMVRLQLIKSDTDYSVFLKYGLPGMDIAVYSPRSHYHTTRDNLNYSSPGSVQYMGNMALAILRGADNADSFLNAEKSQNMVYYDVAGLLMMVYSFNTHVIINGLLLLAVPLLSAFWTFKSNHANSVQSLVRPSLLVARGLLAVFVAFLFMVVVAALAITIMLQVNPMVTYGSAFVATFYISAGCVFALLLSQIACRKISKSLRSNLSHVETGLYGLVAFWSVFVAVGAYLAQREVGFFYYVIFPFVFTSAAAVLFHLLPANQYRLPLVFAVQVSFPSFLLLDNLFLVMDSMRHSTADGTPEAAVYALCTLSIIMVTLQLLPWVNLAGNLRQSALVAGIVFVFAFLVCSAVQPFNSGWSPNKLVFNLSHNVTSELSTVSIIGATASGVSSLLQRILPPNEAASLSCSPFKTYQTQCLYQTDLVPLYVSTVPDEFHLSPVDRSCDGSMCRVDSSITVQHSTLCKIALTAPEDAITKAWAVGQTTSNMTEFESILTYTTTFGDTVPWGIEYRHTDQPIYADIGCYYDEWTNGEIPAFTWLKDHLPDDTILLLRGQGLSLVNFTRIYL